MISDNSTLKEEIKLPVNDDSSDIELDDSSDIELDEIPLLPLTLTTIERSELGRATCYTNSEDNIDCQDEEGNDDDDGDGELSIKYSFMMHNIHNSSIKVSIQEVRK